MFNSELFTPSGVRLRRRAGTSPGPNWLFLPGGPGIGSESLNELVDTLDVPGSLWLVDLPGDGSNINIPEPPEGYFEKWPSVILEAAQALPDCILIGHSTGGMYLLSVPQLEGYIKGLVLISSAPNASWHPRFVKMTLENPLAEVEAASLVFEGERNNENLRKIVMASVPWNFTREGLEMGRSMFARMPFNLDAVDWSEKAFDHTYEAIWWPKSIPVLILSGADDRIVDQSLWDDSAFIGANIVHRIVPNAAHFLWIENPKAVELAFAELATRIQATSLDAIKPSHSAHSENTPIVQP